MFRFLAGKNKAPSHTDIILLDHNFYVDDKLVIEKGKFTPETGL
jgi:leucyl aminopeptidase (aminopeptidase T)